MKSNAVFLCIAFLSASKTDEIDVRNTSWNEKPANPSTK